MRIFGTVDILQFDNRAYTNAVREALAIRFREAARAFLRAAIPLVPVQTGMARGAFLNIGRALRVLVPITPTVHGKFYYPGRLPKTPETGAALTTPPDLIIRFDGNNRMVFEIDTSIIHYTLEDIIGVRSPTAPWRSFEAGRIAFMAEMRNLIRRLPHIGEYITRTTISFGRGGVIRSAPVRLRQQQTIR